MNILFGQIFVWAYDVIKMASDDPLFIQRISRYLQNEMPHSAHRLLGDDWKVIFLVKCACSALPLAFSFHFSVFTARHILLSLPVEQILDYSLQQQIVDLEILYLFGP